MRANMEALRSSASAARSGTRAGGEDERAQAALRGDGPAVGRSGREGERIAVAVDDQRGAAHALQELVARWSRDDGRHPRTNHLLRQ